MSAGCQISLLHHQQQNRNPKFHPDLVSKDKVDAKVKHQLAQELDVALIGPQHEFGSVTEYMINVVYEEEEKDLPLAPSASAAAAGFDLSSSSSFYDPDSPFAYDHHDLQHAVPSLSAPGFDATPSGLPLSPFPPEIDGFPADHGVDMISSSHHHHHSSSASASHHKFSSDPASRSGSDADADADAHAHAAHAAAAAASFGIHPLDVESEAIVGLAGPSAAMPNKASATKVPAIRREPGTEIEDPFFVCDLGYVARKLMQWNRLFPRITPFYAVKCNPNPGIVRTLARLGAGFDCASKAEIALVLEQGVTDPARIMYANPCKAIPELRYAKSKNINSMTFDNADELRKLAKFYPEADLVLRIRTADDHSTIPLGKKFGAELHDCEHLIHLAKELGLHLLGVSFHVGSGCYDVNAYPQAIRDARLVFDMAKKAGIELQLLDIGGGYPGTDEDPVTIEQIADIVNPLLEELFPASSGVRVISEPGRYFAEGSHTLCVEIIGKHNLKTNKVSLTRDNNTGAVFSPTVRTASASSGPDGAAFFPPPFSLDDDPAAKAAADVAGNDGHHSNGNANGGSHPHHASASPKPSPSAVDFHYYINEGVYGSFKDRILIQAKFTPHILWSQKFTKGQNITYEDGLVDPADRKMLDRAARIANMRVVACSPDQVLEPESNHDGSRFPSRIFGPSNHHLDCVSDSVLMPELNPGDWLYFTRMGAYTISLASCFNGNNPPDTRYVWTEEVARHE